MKSRSERQINHKTIRENRKIKQRNEASVTLSFIEITKLMSLTLLFFQFQIDNKPKTEVVVIKPLQNEDFEFGSLYDQATTVIEQLECDRHSIYIRTESCSLCCLL